MEKKTMLENKTIWYRLHTKWFLASEIKLVRGYHYPQLSYGLILDGKVPLTSLSLQGLYILLL